MGEKSEENNANFETFQVAKEQSICRNKNIWVFNAGNHFSGNPKWLFLYILKMHKEITPIWLCYSKNLRAWMHQRGYRAYLFDSANGKHYMSIASVYVVDQVKEVIQPELVGATILNLWHGVGCKTVERELHEGILEETVAKKYITNNSVYYNYQLFLVTSPLMEEHFVQQCGLREDRLIRSAYPNTGSGLTGVSTFDHNIVSKKKLSSNTRIGLYAPTYRDDGSDFITVALPDVDRLCKVLANNDELLIIKVHPQSEQDYSFLRLKELYSSNESLLFWNNDNDIYEIFDQIDFAIVDYSSIFYDLVAAGVSCFVRYFYDYDSEMASREFFLDVKEYTCGQIAHTFDELLNVLGRLQTETADEGIDRIKDDFWSYASQGSMGTIVNATKNFVPQPQELPTLYSFDIFDTLLGRSCGGPLSVFRYVRDQIIKDGSYPDIIAEDYLKIRRWCERNVRELLDKTRTTRKSECREISFDMIFNRMADVYDLNAHQIEMLKQWELESEYAVSVPIQENIDLVMSLLDRNETVILISDMYLPEVFVKDLLAKAEPQLASLPLFLSSTYGVQKSTRKLFLEAYHTLDYKFGEWIHTGDNLYGDVQQAEKLGITAQKFTPTPFTDYERRLINYSQSIEIAQTAVLLRNYRAIEQADIDVFAYSYAALLFVPYLDWVITDAVKRGIETLYFVSRDGDLLKKAADAIIDACGYTIRTKYIYGSRRSWRIPSFIESVDDDFFSEYGNLIGADTFDELLNVLAIDGASLIDMHPEFKQLSQKVRLEPADVQMVRKTLQRSDKYKAYLLNYAKQERKVVLRYLTQEIDFSESFAFVEYWARGYTQTCLNRLLRIIKPGINPPMYYARSIYPSTDESIRINFQTNTTSLIFVEFLFTNLPYSTTFGYQQDGEIVKPVFANNETFRKDIYDAICNGVKKFSHDYCEAFPRSRSELNRLLFNFAMTEFRLRPEEPWFCSYIGPLQHTAAAAGKSSEFAPPITMKVVMHSLATGEGLNTSSRKMTLARTGRLIRFAYEVAKRTKLWKHLKKFYANHLRKRN